MKKTLTGIIAAVLMLSANAAYAEVSPKITVDERKLVFEDQAPVIAETGKTLIPLRFVCNSAGAKVDWDGEKQKITVTSGDNRNMVELFVGNDEMTVYYYPSVLEVVTDVQKLEQPPVIMNDRTMIPVREVLEAIGATVDWEEETQSINITSRAYSRYLRDMGVEGYDVNYPLSGGAVSFDKAPETLPEKAYDKKTDLPMLSLSTEAAQVKKDDIIDVYVDISNIEKYSENPAYLSTFSAGLVYDHEKLEYNGHMFLNGEEEYGAVLESTNETFRPDCMKISSVVSLSTSSDRTPVSNGHIVKVSFKVLTDGAAEISISDSIHSRIGKDTELGFDFGESAINTIGEANELYIDTTALVIE